MDGAPLEAGQTSSMYSTMMRDSAMGLPWWSSTGIFLCTGLDRSSSSLFFPTVSCSISCSTPFSFSATTTRFTKGLAQPPTTRTAAGSPELSADCSHRNGLYIYVLASEFLPKEESIEQKRSQKLQSLRDVCEEHSIAMAGGGDELKLLGMWASPFALRAKLALSFKGLSYDYVEEDFKNKSDLLLSSNPVHKKVPVLIHNGKPICESQVIVQYIDEVFPDAGVTLLPADPHDRAVARFWAAYIDEKLFSAWILVFRSKTEEEKAEAVKQTFAVVEKLEGALSECSKGKPFFGGDTVGYVDVVLGGFVAWVHAIEEVFGLNQFDAAKTPLLAAWLERFDELDAVKEVMPDIGRLVELAKMRQAQAAAAAAAVAAAAAGEAN
uniref:glutathione transferase n=1 Tax=Oryza rufipogon TaxID=4529 RepID=A0A0E0R1M7_ORYRU